MDGTDMSEDVTTALFDAFELNQRLHSSIWFCKGQFTNIPTPVVRATVSVPGHALI
jgi:hypothetical protein